MRKRIFNVITIIAVMTVLFVNVSVVLNHEAASYLKYGSISAVLAQSSGSGSGGTSLPGGNRVESIVLATINYSKTSVGPTGLDCVEVGTIQTVTCVGTGTKECTPSSTQVSGPFYSGGCLRP